MGDTTTVETIPLSFAYTPTMSRYTKANHSVYMRFERRRHWHVTFLDTGLEHELPRKLTFESPEKILELARKCEAWNTLEARQSLERAIAAGGGGCYLRLTPDQYAQLRRV